MKLISSFLSLLPVAYPATFQKGNSIQQVPDDSNVEDFDDAVPLWMDRANADGGSCPGPSFNDIFQTYKHQMYDFRGGIRYRFNAEPAEEVKLTLDEERDGTIWWGSGQFDTVYVNDYSGKTWFKSLDPATPKTMYAYPFGYENNGGWFCVRETRNRNDLRFAYGNKFHQKHDGFVPHYGLVLTWIYTSSDDDGCPSDEGNIFQMVIMLGRKDRKKHQTRIVFNFPVLNYPADVTESNQPLVGFKDKRPDPDNEGAFLETAWWHPDMNDPSDDISNLVGHTYVYKDFNEQNENSPIFGDNWAAIPNNCETQRACHCDSFLDNDQITWETPDGSVLLNTPADIAEKQVHWDIYGHCSIDDDTLNYGDFSVDGRGYWCYVKSQSSDCTDGGKFMWPFTKSNYPSADEDQMVQVTKFECVISKSMLNMKPYWRRWRTTAEKRLNRAIKAAAAAGRRAAKKNRRNNRNFVKKTKWQKRQANRAKKAGDRDGPKLRMGASYKIECEFGCQHPDEWATSSTDLPNSPGAIWQGIDMLVGGNWECFDSDGNPEAGPELEKGGMCRIKCDDGSTFDAEVLHCQYWEKLYGAHQYGVQDLRDFATALSDSGFSC